MDSFSVSIAAGITAKKARLFYALKVAVFFGFFQAFMPLIGWMVGGFARNIITNIDHWIAFFLLSGIGAKMISQSFKEKEKGVINFLDNKTLLMLAVATSIDALVVGISFEFIKTPVLTSIIIIGVVTLVLCIFGFLFGGKLGSFVKKRIEILGGLALIGIGLKILLEHLL